MIYYVWIIPKFQLYQTNYRTISFKYCVLSHCYIFFVEDICFNILEMPFTSHHTWQHCIDTHLLTLQGNYVLYVSIYVMAFSAHSFHTVVPSVSTRKKRRIMSRSSYPVIYVIRCPYSLFLHINQMTCCSWQVIGLNLTCAEKRCNWKEIRLSHFYVTVQIDVLHPTWIPIGCLSLPVTSDCS
jgi:hypothetical protein